MIEMIAGVYGLPVEQPDGTIRVVGKGPKSGHFSVDPAREAELVAKGIARYVGEPVDTGSDETYPIGMDDMPTEDYAEANPLSKLTAAELRKFGKECGLTFKANMSKAEMIAELEAYQEQHMDDGEDAPAFNAAEAVQ